jgi:hypothetical protein
MTHEKKCEIKRERIPVRGRDGRSEGRSFVNRVTFTVAVAEIRVIKQSREEASLKVERRNTKEKRRIEEERKTFRANGGLIVQLP